MGQLITYIASGILELLCQLLASLTKNHESTKDTNQNRSSPAAYRAPVENERQHYLQKSPNWGLGFRQGQPTQVREESYKTSRTIIESKQKPTWNESNPVNGVFYRKPDVNEFENSKLKSKGKKNFQRYDGEVKFSMSYSEVEDNKRKESQERCIMHGELVYQGKGRCYGCFECDCGRTWESGYCWVGYGQKCQSCGSEVYPYCKHCLAISDNHSDPNKPHPMELCGKCRALRSPCYKIGYYQ